MYIYVLQTFTSNQGLHKRSHLAMFTSVTIVYIPTVRYLQLLLHPSLKERGDLALFDKRRISSSVNGERGVCCKQKRREHIEARRKG